MGELLDHLRAEGLAGDTGVIFSSDNGPVLDDGYLDEALEKCGDHKPAGPLRGGKYSLFDGGARVPMLAWGPGRVKQGHSPALFSHVDFLASFLAMSDVDSDPETLGDSCDMSAVLVGEDLKGRDSLVPEGTDAKTLVRKANGVFIPPYEGAPLYWDKGIESGHSSEPQLYDLEEDIGQRNNIAKKKPEIVDELFTLLKGGHGRTPQVKTALPF